MGKIKTIAFVAGIATLLTACNNNKTSFDASGYRSSKMESSGVEEVITQLIKQVENAKIRKQPVL